MKPNIKNYAKPRPVWMMVLGETLDYTGKVGAGIAIFSDEKWWAIALLLIGSLSQFFTKLYTAQTNSTKIEYEVSQDESGEVIENLTVTENKSINPKNNNQ